VFDWREGSRERRLLSVQYGLVRSSTIIIFKCLLPFLDHLLTQPLPDHLSCPQLLGISSVYFVSQGFSAEHYFMFTGHMIVEYLLTYFVTRPSSPIAVGYATYLQEQPPTLTQLYSAYWLNRLRVPYKHRLYTRLYRHNERLQLVYTKPRWLSIRAVCLLSYFLIVPKLNSVCITVGTNGTMRPVRMM